MGCDGVYETKTNIQICKHINKRLKQNPKVKLSILCEDLLDNLISMDLYSGIGCDNMSCILIKF